MTRRRPSRRPTESSIEPSQEYFAQAREIFQSGQYQDALRLAGHAAVEAPRNPEVHELASLALFALKDYRGATMEAHAALTLGPPIDWPTLYSYYENVDTYTNQLRALEKFVHDNPKAPEGHFLLGYQFIMTGTRMRRRRSWSRPSPWRRTTSWRKRWSSICEACMPFACLNGSR